MRDKKTVKKKRGFLQSGILEDLRSQIKGHGILTLSMRLILSRVYEQSGKICCII